MREIKGKLNRVLAKKIINWKKIEIIAFRIDINHLFSFKFKVNFPQGPLIVKDYSRRFLKF